MKAPPKFAAAIAQASNSVDMNQGARYGAAPSQPKRHIRYHPLNGNREECRFLRSIDYAGNEDVVRAYLRGISCAQGFLPYWATFESRSGTLDRPAGWQPARVFMTA